MHVATGEAQRNPWGREFDFDLRPVGAEEF